MCVAGSCTVTSRRRNERAHIGMKDLLNTYSGRAPEIVFEWTDSETEARGWVVINSLRGGAAGGGTRMRKGLDRMEVVSLAKTMEIKFHRQRSTDWWGQERHRF